MKCVRSCYKNSRALTFFSLLLKRLKEPGVFISDPKTTGSNWKLKEGERVDRGPGVTFEEAAGAMFLGLDPQKESLSQC